VSAAVDNPASAKLHLTKSNSCPAKLDYLFALNLHKKDAATKLGIANQRLKAGWS
jgi:hypothetical protein